MFGLEVKFFFLLYTLMYLRTCIQDVPNDVVLAKKNINGRATVFLKAGTFSTIDTHFISGYWRGCVCDHCLSIVIWTL